MSAPTAAAGIARPRNLALGLAILCAAGGAAYWLWANSATPIQSIAVLSFADNTPQRNREPLANGITYEITDSLARIPGLRVMGATTVLATRDPSQLQVEALLNGEVQEADGRLRVAVVLTRAENGSRLWAHTYNYPMREASVIEQEISRAIARHVPGAHGWRPGKKPRAIAAEAYVAYLEGRYWAGKGDPESLRTAIKKFEKATEVEPLFARGLAWESISEAYLVEADAEPPNSIMPSARDAAERAATLEPDSGETHVALGIVRLQYDREWEDAKQELDRTVEQSPGSPMGWQWRGRWYAAMDRIEEAFAETQKAQTIDPLSPRILADLAVESMALGRPDHAAEFVQKSAEVSPRVRIAALYQSGQKDKAALEFEEYRKTAAAARLPAPLWGAFPAFEPYVQEARATLTRIEELRTVRFTPADTFAMMAATVRDKEAFFEWADTAYDERSPHLAYWRLRPGLPVEDPRFQELLERMNLPTPMASRESKRTE